MEISYNNDSQMRITVAQGSEVIGYVVIDSIIGGHSYGGLRFMPDINEAEISILARAMTLKLGFLGLPHGGAKAGVIGDPEEHGKKRLERLKVFGQAIAPLLVNRIYMPATDMGTSVDDIRYMAKSSGVRIKRRDYSVERSGHYTALTVFSGIKQASRHLGLKIPECTVAIEGFGKVGSALGKLLSDAKARVVAISTSRGAIYNPKGFNLMRLNRLATEVGSRVVEFYTDAERIDREALLELPVDILSPCALCNSIHSGNAGRVTARIISSGANHPVTIEAERVLFEKGILCLPDFVTNCGGVLGGTMEFASVNPQRIAEFIDLYIGLRIALLLDNAARERVTPREIALPLAMERFEKVRRNAAHSTPLAKLFGFSLEFYRRGFIPGSIVGALAPGYFKKILT